MGEYYNKQQQDHFVKELTSRQNTLRSLQNSSIKIKNSNSLNRSKGKDAKAIMNERFGQHFSLLKDSIHNMEQECHKFGGLQFIRKEMDRNEMDKKEYVDYHLSRIGNNFQLPQPSSRLPQISSRSQSLKQIKTLPSKSIERNEKMRYNKWFIPPQQRFSKSKQQTLYAWNRQSFVLNIIRNKDHTLEHDYLPKFIQHCKEKSNREPLLCKYTQIKRNER